MAKVNQSAMKPVRIIDAPEKIDRDRWTRFLESHPDATVFQSPDLFDLISRAPQYEPVVTCATDQDENVTGILFGFLIREKKGLLGIFYSRVIVYGGPLIDPTFSDNLILADILIKAFIDQVRKRSILIQFRNFRVMTEYTAIFEKHGFIFHHHLNLLVSISGREDPMARISKSKLRQVRKSLDAGAIVEEASSLEEIRQLYTILGELYRRKVKKPLPDVRFFEEFFQLSRHKKLGIILVVKYDGKVVGGMVCPITPGKVVYEWYICGMDKDHKKIHPSILATWGAIQYAMKNNFHSFDFMGIGHPKKEYNVRNFKVRFGGEVVNYGRFTRVNNRIVYLISLTGHKILALFEQV